MFIKRLLIFLPLILILILGQSFFWVPTYDTQSKGNPHRLVKYIHGSIGDAQILNPALNADQSSADIVELVFDGLIGQDDQLQLRPRLATGWIQYEEAYLLLDTDFKREGFKPTKPEDWITWLGEGLGDNLSWMDNIKSMEIISQNSTQGSVKSPEFDSDGKQITENGKPKLNEIKYSINKHFKLKFTLRNIDQEFFDPIKSLIGPKYFEEFPLDKLINANDSSQKELLKSQLINILPVVEHNPIIVFDLRPGVRFHDGHEFDSGDVLFTYQAIMDTSNASPRRSDYEPVKSAEILGPLKIKFVYKRLFSPAINAWFMGILPEHLLNKEALNKEANAKGLDDEKTASFTVRDSKFNRNPIGTGPFVFKEWLGDELIRLSRNSDYWEGAPEYEEYIMRIIPDPLTQEMEFYAGAVDSYNVLPHQVARLKKDEKYQSFSSVGYNYSYIGYNIRNPLFAQKEVRQALGMAIDVDKIIKYVLYDEGERVTGPYPKITNWYDPTVKAVPYDPEGALKIFNDLGWSKNSDGYLEKDGKVFEFNLITNNGNSLRKSILTIVQNNWKKIGIKVNAQVFEWAVFLKDFVNVGKFDALILGWSMGIDFDLYQIWHSSQAGPQQLNFVGYKNPEADKLIVKLRREYDPEKQRQMAREIHRQIAQAQPYTFLFVKKTTQLLDKKIVLVDRKPNGEEKFSKIYPTKDGNTRYYFNKWRKLESVPQFAP